MGLFNFLKNKEQIGEEVETKDSLPEIREEDFIDNSEPLEQENSTYIVEFGSRLPIDIIYGFLKENYEAKAYNDALTIPDESYKETQLEIIRGNLEVKFKQVMLKYEGMLHDIDFHIQSRNDSGLTEISKLFKSKKETCEKHIEELKKMKQDLDKEELYMTGIFKSYEAGFKRGIASISLQKLQKLDTL